MTSLIDRPTATSVSRSFLWMSLSGVITIGNSVLIWVFLARMREPAEVGRFTIAMGLYALFYGIVSLGLLPYLINETSRRRAHRKHSLAASAGLLLAISGGLSVVVMSMTAFVISGSYDVRAGSAILSLSLVPTAIIVVFDAMAIAGGRARLSAIVSVAENMLRSVIPLGLIWAGYDITVICASFTLIRFLALAAYIVVLRSDVVKLTFSRADFRRVLSVVPTFAATITLASMIWQAPLLVLSYLSTEAETASFGVASRFLIPVSILMGAYANAIQPVLARKLITSPQDLEAHIYRLGAYPALAAGAGVLAAVLFSGQVVEVLFGAAYQDSAAILIILSVSALPFCMVMVLARGLITMRLQRIDLLANALGVAFSISFAVALIPHYGAVGAAVAQLSSFLIMMLIETVSLARHAGSKTIRTVSYS